jgi:hypothetical protein
MPDTDADACERCQVVKEGLFNGGPPTRLYGWLRLRSHAERRAMSLAVGAALVCWLPLALLAAAQGALFGSSGPGAFQQDIAVHARYLIALPLLIAATPACVSTLGMLAEHFSESGLVLETDRGRFDAVISSTRRLRDFKLVEIGVIVAAYTIVAASVCFAQPAYFPSWYTAGDGVAANLSAAGWWQVLVCLPLLLIVVLGWLWRLFLWGRLLWLVSRLDLRLLPAHPDRAAGLRFVGYSINAQMPFAAALGVIAAGMIANRVIHEAASLLTYKYVVIGVVSLVVVLVVAPLLVFSALSSNAQAGRLIPADTRSVILLVAMTLLPFIPLA